MTPNGCQSCLLRPSLCHGEDGGLGLGGCVSFDHKKCSNHEWTCLCNPDRLFHRFRESGGFECKLAAPLKPLTIELPTYIPTYYHAFCCAKPLNVEWVALPLHTLLSPDGTFGANARNGSELRQSLCLHPATKIIVTGPGPDQSLEDFWRFHRKASLFEVMLACGVEVFTVPNFSFFLDSPPLHHRYNRSRILRVAERASAAGLSAVLHLNALHEQEWQDWEQLLKDHAEIKTVCLEFQTGYTSPVLGDKAFERLVTLQKNVGRPLHPILVGGAKYAGRLGNHFAAKTIIDAHPFIKTVKRRICIEHADLSIAWKFHPSAPGESLDARFKANLRRYSNRIAERLEGKKLAIQGEFPFHIIPKRPAGHRKQKPVGNLPLFGQSIERADDIPPEPPLLSSLRPNRLLASDRTAVAKAPVVPKSGSATSPANSRRRNNPRTLRPNGSATVKTAGAQDAH